jgi:hypothetical protein
MSCALYMRGGCLDDFLMLLFHLLVLLLLRNIVVFSVREMKIARYGARNIENGGEGVRHMCGAL